MATTLSFKDAIDLPEWRPTAVAPNAHAAGGSLACDLRNTEDRLPEVYQLATAAILNCYSMKHDGWGLVGSPALAGTFGIGATAVMAPARGPRGTIAAGATSSQVTLSTALPAAVGVHQLTGRGDGIGFKVRIVDNGAGGSGRIAEMYVVANTSGTTPVLTLSTTPGGAPATMGFTPVSGSAYEFLSGRVYMLSAGTLAAGVWKYYDVLTNSFSGNLATTNLPGTINTDTAAVCLDEQYVPNDNYPGEGFVVGAGTYNAIQPTTGGNLRCLTATATAAGTITGQAAGGDATVLANEFRNFVIRIVEDTTNVTAVGQRRRITSHTGGASAVYTVNGNWTVTPSSSAKFVIENSDEIIVFSSASASTFVYAPDTIGSAQTGDTWSTTTYSARGAVVAAGCQAFQGFGVPTTKVYGSNPVDAARSFRWSHIFAPRGGATLDILDVAGGANGAWTLAAVYGGAGAAFAAGSCGVYDPVSTVGVNPGCYYYVNQAAGAGMYRFNVFSRDLQAWAQLRFAQSTAAVGARMALKSYIDGSTRVTMPMLLLSTSVNTFDTLAQR